MDKDDILKRLSEERHFVWIKRRVSPIVAEKISRAEIPGVFGVTEYRRFYPLKSLAAHTIGFAGVDSKGLEGLELFYDRDLKSEPIPVTAQKDALGRPVMFAAMEKGPGRRDLLLTLDRKMQYVLERELGEAVRTHRAKGGVGVIMAADSGEILALAVRPTYNLNTFSKAPAKVRRNRAIVDTFEPGSTFKVFTAASALEMDKADVLDSIYCHNGLLKVGPAKIHDTRPHKWLTLEQVIVYSSNIGAAKISRKLTRYELYRFLRRFGFGSPTDVDLPGERGGLIPEPGKWSGVSKANIAFGQGVTVNALQLCRGFAAIVNGGLLVKPHLMKRIIKSHGGTVIENRQGQPHRIIRASTSAKMLGILRKVVTRGTGKAANVEGLEIIGKTGTAQKARKTGGYSRERYVASFLGAVMNLRPRVVIYVMLDEPSNRHKTGGKVAAPVFREVAKGIASMCGGNTNELPPLQTAGLNKPWPRVQAGARRVKVKRGPGEGQWIMPDLTGLNMREALDICAKIKADIIFKGNGKAVRQIPAPGTAMAPGSRITVFFEG
jgi:cell division protein FtsI (penicillin-binding protein 3)